MRNAPAAPLWKKRKFLHFRAKIPVRQMLTAFGNRKNKVYICIGKGRRQPTEGPFAPFFCAAKGQRTARKGRFRQEVVFSKCLAVFFKSEIVSTAGGIVRGQLLSKVKNLNSTLLRQLLKSDKRPGENNLRTCGAAFLPRFSAKMSDMGKILPPQRFGIQLAIRQSVRRM